MPLPDLMARWDTHYNTYLWLMVFIWAVVTLPLIYFGIRYHRKRPDEDGGSGSGNLFLEILWTVIPLAIVTFLGIQTWALYRDFRKVPQDAYEVRVEGYMWGWNMTYPNGRKTRNELRVPVGKPVKVYLSSQDVLHAFYLPAFRTQEEAIPGRTTHLWFQAAAPGEYDIFCTEFCGAGHSLMRGKVIAMEPAAFEQWVVASRDTALATARDGSQSAAAPTAEKGKQLMDDNGCLACHTITADKGIGPSFKGLFGKKESFEDGTSMVVDEGYVKESILTPTAKIVKGFTPSMPAFKLSDSDIQAITEYLKTLK